MVNHEVVLNKLKLKLNNLYSTLCIFDEFSDTAPIDFVFGVRSIIENSGEIIIDIKSKKIGINYGKGNYEYRLQG